MSAARRLLVAIGDFDRLAHQRIHELAAHLGRPISAFADPLLRMQLPEHQQGGSIASWTYGFHGFECRFDGPDGQCVEVRLGFGTCFGVLDPEFLRRFILTTPAFEDLRDELATFAAVSNALDELERAGDLVPHVADFGETALRGLAQRCDSATIHE
jgi:hypothetical protein